VFNSSKWWDFHHYWLIEQYNLLRETAPTISFPESHDTARLCQELNGNIAGLRQRYFFSALFSAGVMMPMGFEFGFRKPLHVVNTTPADWERDGIDLSEYIQKVNGIKQTYAVFREESPTWCSRSTFRWRISGSSCKPAPRCAMSHRKLRSNTSPNLSVTTCALAREWCWSPGANEAGDVGQASCL
jgi:hypothetical protein